MSTFVVFSVIKTSLLLVITGTRVRFVVVTGIAFLLPFDSIIFSFLGAGDVTFKISTSVMLLVTGGVDGISDDDGGSSTGVCTSEDGAGFSAVV